jgi:signal transduction histidine kinase
MDQVERLDRLVDSILASVRIVPPEAATVTPTDVEATINEVVESIGPIVRQHRLEVRHGLGHFALADAPRLRQILEHLIENAVKYAPPDTTITIDQSLVEGSVRIGVTDQGPGVPEEWRERIFEPYARRETHTARGSGIGLYAAKRLGESMGARLWVEPAEPTGARFVLSLPAAAAV